MNNPLRKLLLPSPVVEYEMADGQNLAVRIWNGKALFWMGSYAEVRTKEQLERVLPKLKNLRDIEDCHKILAALSGETYP